MPKVLPNYFAVEFQSAKDGDHFDIEYQERQRIYFLRFSFCALHQSQCISSDIYSVSDGLSK